MSLLGRLRINLSEIDLPELPAFEANAVAQPAQNPGDDFDEMPALEPA